jgi:translation elongation factor EF-Ts
MADAKNWRHFMTTTCQEISDNDIQQLRSMVGVKLTDSDCRVALRETDGNYNEAYHWLLENRVIDKIKIDMARRVAGVMVELSRELVEVLDTEY